MLAEIAISILLVLCIWVGLVWFRPSKTEDKIDEVKIKEVIKKQSPNTTYLRRRQRNRKKKHESQAHT